MNKKLLFAFSMICGASFGQTFDASNEYANSTTQNMYQIDSAASNMLTNTGNSAVIWDYSSYAQFPNSLKTFSVAANTSPDYGTNTNKVVAIQNVITTYLETNANGRQITGIEYSTGNAFLATVKINFSTGNPINLMTYPFNYNDEIIDDCSGTLFVSTSQSAATGSSSSKFDGIGTLKLSNGVTLTNIARHHLTTNITSVVTILPTPTNVDLTIDQFDYYDLSSGSYLPEFTYVKVNFVTTGGVSLSNILNFALSTSQPNQFVGMPEFIASEFSIFPVPAKNEINVNSDKFNGTEVFVISTLEGKIVLKSDSNKNINVSNLPSGVYMVSTVLDGKTVNEKFIKE